MDPQRRQQLGAEDLGVKGFSVGAWVMFYLASSVLLSWPCLACAVPSKESPSEWVAASKGGC